MRGAERGLQTVTVRFARGGPNRNGFSSASVAVHYTFNVCGGYLVIATRVDPATSAISNRYWYNGTEHDVNTEPADYRVSSVPFAGRVVRGGQIIGTFRNHLAGNALSFDCFSGDYVRVGTLRSFFPNRVTTEELVAFVKTLTLEMDPAPARAIHDVEVGIRRKLECLARQRRSPFPVSCMGPSAAPRG